MKCRAVLSLVLSQGGEDQAPEWSADQHKRGFVIRRVTSIAKCNKAEKEEEDCGMTFEGEISDNNPLWDSADDESHNHNAPFKSITYVQRKSTKSAQNPRASTHLSSHMNRRWASSRSRLTR